MSDKLKSLAIVQILSDLDKNRRVAMDGEQRMTISVKQVEKWRQHLIAGSNTLQSLEDRQASGDQSSGTLTLTSSQVSWWPFSLGSFGLK